EERHQKFGDAAGWGQFLDGPVANTQIGLYGTSAGILVRALAGRANSPLGDKVLKLAHQWWQQRDSDARAREILGQTLRLAFLNLALRTSDPNQRFELTREVGKTLRQRILGEMMWGNYW